LAYNQNQKKSNNQEQGISKLKLSKLMR